MSKSRRLYKITVALLLVVFTVYCLVCPGSLFHPCTLVISPKIVLVTNNASSGHGYTLSEHDSTSSEHDNSTIGVGNNEHTTEPNKPVAVKSTQTGEERAAAVWARCQSSPDPVPCFNVARPVDKRLLPVFSRKFALCSLGKTGTSNWKTLILQLNGVISDEEAAKMTYPHAKRLWVGGGTLFEIRETSKNIELAKEINKQYYRITFVRDPLSRLLSAYRDKFTGTSNKFEFRIYRTYRAQQMCDALKTLLKTRPDGQLVPEEMYSYISSEVAQNCHNTTSTASLGVFLAFLVFTPQNLDGSLNTIYTNAHFTNMLSLCSHCYRKFDFIGTVETMSEDVAFLKNKFNITHQFPNISSTQEGVSSVAEVREMWDQLPEMMQQYALFYMQDDARIFDYPGYDTWLPDSANPKHLEKQHMCRTPPDT